MILTNYDAIETLRSVDQLQGFRYYLRANVDEGSLFSNPLRPLDNPDETPSAVLKWFGEKLVLVDFGDKRYGGDLIKIAQLVSPKAIDYRQAIEKIIIDSKEFNRSDFQNIYVPRTPMFIPIEYKVQPYTNFDKEWWGKRGIEINTLWNGMVRSCEKFRVGSNKYWSEYSEENPIYAYLNYRPEIVKIYRPLANKMNKFRWNGNTDDVMLALEGWDEYVRGDSLVIIKSRKDRLYLKQRGVKVLATPSEGMIPKKQWMDSLQIRFKRIIVFYDRDRMGVTSVRQIWQKPYKCDFFFIPKEFSGKDITGFHEKYGEKITNEIIISKLNGHHN